MIESAFFNPQSLVILDNMMNGVYMVDVDKKITYWNTSAERITGFKAEEVLGKPCKDTMLLHALGDKVLCDTHCLFDEALRNKDFVPITRTVNLRHKDGYRLLVRARCIPLLDGSGEVVGSTEIFERVYDQESTQVLFKGLEHQFAHLDPITGIPNRRCLEDTLNDWMQTFYTKSTPFAVVMVDAGFSKDVDEGDGQETWNFVLKAISGVLRHNLRSLDVVGRWSEKEFLVLLHNIPIENLRRKLEIMKSIVEDEGIARDGVAIKVTPSLGCVIPKKGDTTASLLARAEELLRRSGQGGLGRIALEDV